ncbi:hypothetical protein [Natronococcus wangiae]|uniref:hypothetical protein n=1 Tax=Natronococcus wangiae TaxID=3068275 RepID=UPI00273D1560|nr:hypothetical protein [Natronococcus sp. AD5]
MKIVSSYISEITGVLVILLLAPLGVVLFSGAENLYYGDAEAASDYASFASGIATIILVIITGFYSVQTKKQANSAERAREQRDYREKIEQFRRKQSLRKALKEEIDRTVTIGGGESAELVAGMRKPVPRSMYDENAHQIGLLSDEEVGAIVEYYNVASTIEEMAHIHRSSDDEHLTAISRLLELLEEKQTEASDKITEKMEHAEPPQNPLDN